VGLADSNGYAFLTIYLGLTGAFLLGPYILKPILSLCREYQLTSIADLLAFRYGGRGTGFIVTIFMLIGLLPYISLQIRAVTQSIQVLSKQVPPNLLALVFCLMITVFAILFGARHLSPREKHHGLVLAIAFESAIKLFALLVAGAFVLTQVFDSPMAMNEWLAKNPESVSQLYEPAQSGFWSTLLFLAFCAAFLLPRQYHMAFVENENPAHLKTAYWLFPLYLLLLNLPIVPILFAGRYLELNTAPDFYVLGITLSLGKEWLAILVFLGGLSAASAMMIVTTLALSYMALNHLLLPASLSGNQPDDFYRRLLWSKRVMIALIIAAGYAFHIVIELNEGLASLGLISFVAAAQLLPGVFGVLYWNRATQAGFIAGLLGGAVVWFLMLILPLLSPSANIMAALPIETDIWTLSTFCTLTANVLLFVLGSLLSKPTLDGVTASQVTIDEATFALNTPYTARSVHTYLYAMQQVVGNKVAQEEIHRALEETGIDFEETRPAELRLLHEQLERNMSGLVGPTLARSILRLKQAGDFESSNESDSRLLEMRLEASREQMRGMTKQLDDLRRYLRDILRELPLGACSLSANGNIFLWNSAMQTITGIDERIARNQTLTSLTQPWSKLLAEFAESDDNHRFRCSLNHAGKTVSVNIHKADIGAPDDSNPDLTGLVILMEDRTDFDTLEAELAHSERLASVGRLAAGVAHEIGNPLTGIASIAQNLGHDVRHDQPENNQQSPVVEQVDDILDQVSRINGILRSLLNFSHADDISGDSNEHVNVQDSVNEALRLVTLSPDTRAFKFVVGIPNEATVFCDPNQLVQVFVNLLNNAVDASESGDRISVIGKTVKGQYKISVIDEGSGIKSDIRDQIFEPFFTTKPVGDGTGLGLSLVFSIVTNMGGRIRIEQSDSSGTHVVLYLPTSAKL